MNPAPEQTWDPEGYARHARFVADLGMPVVDLLDPKPGEHILDLGCGDGHLTAKLAALGCEVVGVDASPEFVAAARTLGVDAQVNDASALAFDGDFDAVFSNAVLHWIPAPQATLAGVLKALKPGGRFVAECGGAGCVLRIREALAASLRARGLDFEALNPWYFPSAEDYRGHLERAGFEVQEIRVFPRPTPLPGEMKGWLETFALSFTKALPESERTDFLQETQERLRDDLCDASGSWTADYTRLRFRALKIGD